MIIVAVYDSKVEAFLAPIATPNVAVALRMFTDIVNTPGNDMNKFPEDYTLFEVGTWDEKIGLLSALSTPKSVVLGSLVVKKSEVM